MDHMPIFMNLKTRRALVVGGSQLASRKAALLLNACPQIDILSRDPSPGMLRLIEAHGLRQRAETFEPSHLDGIALVIAATEDQVVNKAVFDAASERGVPVNVADQPALCSFILPAIVDRAPVTVAVSTGGRSPVFARHIKALLERALPQGTGQAARWLARWRKPVRTAMADECERRRFWEQIIDGPIGELAQRDPGAADAAMQEYLDNPGSSAGHLRVIGVEPEDIDSISIAAHRELTRADLVVLEPEAGRSILQLCRREAEVRELSHRANSSWITARVREGRRVALLRSQKQIVRRIQDATMWRQEGIDVRVLPAAPLEHVKTRPQTIAA